MAVLGGVVSHIGDGGDGLEVAFVGAGACGMPCELFDCVVYVCCSSYVVVLMVRWCVCCLLIAGEESRFRSLVSLAMAGC